MKAIFIKQITKGFRGDARLFHVDPPMKYDKYVGDENKVFFTSFVVVSAALVMFSGYETYIFPADENGKVIDWGDMEGSFRGEMNHKRALENAGYSVEE